MLWLGRMSTSGSSLFLRPLINSLYVRGRYSFLGGTFTCGAVVKLLPKLNMGIVLHTSYIFISGKFHLFGRVIKAIGIDDVWLTIFFWHTFWDALFRIIRCFANVWLEV